MISRQISRICSSIARDDTRLEPRRDGTPVVDVTRRIHREEHHAHHLELLGREILEHDSAGTRREQVGFARDMHDVGVPQHRPVARLAAHLLPVHGLGAAQLGELLVRRTLDVGVGVGEIQPGGGSRQDVGSRQSLRFAQRVVRGEGGGPVEHTLDVSRRRRGSSSSRTSGTTPACCLRCTATCAPIRPARTAPIPRG